MYIYIKYKSSFATSKELTLSSQRVNALAKVLYACVFPANGKPTIMNP